MRWKEKWKKPDVGTLPTNAIDALEACNADFFRSVRKLLTVLAIISPKTATSEPNFSTVRHFKMCPKSKIGEQRLTGLALLSISGIDQSTKRACYKFIRQWLGAFKI